MKRLDPAAILLSLALSATSLLHASADVPPSTGRGAVALPSDQMEPYVVGPEDVLVLNGLNAEDIVGKPMRIDAKGDLTLPLIGTVHAGGLTIHQLEAVLNQRLSVFVKSPQLVVSVSEYKSQPVSVVGAVNSPGIHQIQGRKTIVEMISLAGGPRVDSGSVVTVTRPVAHGRLPLPTEHLDSTRLYSTAEVSLRDLTSGFRPDENIPVMPNDVLAVSRASTVYVIGEVKKSGGFVIGDENQMTVIQALSMAQGSEHTADLKHARIIRNSQIAGKRQEITCDLRRILNGKDEDIGMQAQDILYVPGSTGKRVALRAIETAVTTGSGIVIWSAR